MARFRNNPFPNADPSQYMNWQKVVTPDGQTYYVVPGNAGYVYDPVASNATGDTVYRKNPQQQIDQYNAQKEAQKQDQFNRSPAGQLLPVAGSTVGLIAAHEIMKPSVTAQQIIRDGSGNITGTLMSDGTVKGVNGVITQTANPTAVIPVSNGAVAANGAIASNAGKLPTPQVVGATRITPVGTDAATGGTIMSDGTVQTNTLPAGAEVTADGSIVNTSTGEVIGQIVQGALGAYQIYTGVNRFKDDKIGGGLDVASGGSNVAAALGNETAASFAGPITAIKGGYDTFNSLQNGGEGIRGSTTTLGAGIGTIVGGPGLGTAAGAALGNVLGYGLQGDGIKNRLALGLTTGGLGFIPGVRGALTHKTTKQEQQENTQKLVGMAPEDQSWQAYLGQARKGYGQAPADKENPYQTSDGRKYRTWEDYKKGGLEAATLTHANGILKLAGPEYGSFTEDQRRAVTQAFIDNDLLTSEKGEIELKDQKKGQEIYDAVKKGFNASPVSNGQIAAQGALRKPTPIIGNPNIKPVPGLILK